MASGTATTSAAATTGSSATTDSPLALTIDTLTPSSIPRTGKVRVSGWVTNNSEETWSAVNVHAFIGSDPITTTADLAFESTRDPEEWVGDRITVPGTFDTIPEIAPGASAPYTVRVPVDLLDADEPGVYWFGVHALGQSASASIRDSVADGRARTFLPLVPRAARNHPIATSLVLPIRAQVRNAPDGSLDDVEDWVRDLDDSGRLGAAVDFGIAAGSLPITWLVDPAVPDAVSRLVAGNPPRELVVPTPEEETTEGPAASDSATPGGSGETATTEGSTAASPGEDAGAAATAWLVKLQQALTGKQVLALPWGDVDVAAAAKRGPDVYSDARARSGTVLTQGQFPMNPAISAPSGFLDDAALGVADEATTILLSDRAVTRGAAPSVASYAGKRLILSSAAALAGGPGPNDPIAPVALRQRILSEAALRLDDPARQPLVVVFPPGWTAPDGRAFFDGIDVNWMQLASLDQATAVAPRPLASDRFSYPSWQLNHEVDLRAFDAFAHLTEEANRLQGVLTDATDLAARIRVDSLGNLSYFAREDAVASQQATLDTTSWVTQRLHSITVSAPRRVILSSDSGSFSVTVTNGLDQPVAVRLEATSVPPMTITSPDEVQLGPGASTTVLLQASTDKLGVHTVRIALTDTAGNPLGSSDILPVRAGQVSQVIWLVLGGAVALLLLAIVLRLVRRIRSARHGGAGGPDGPVDPVDPGEPGESGESGEPGESGGVPHIVSVTPTPTERGGP